MVYSSDSQLSLASAIVSSSGIFVEFVVLIMARWFYFP